MNDNTVDLKRLSVRVDAFRRAMESIMAGNTPDHAKWGVFKYYATTYNKLARIFVDLTGEEWPAFNVDAMKGSNETLWPNQKQIFDGVYAQTLMLSAVLSAYDTGISASISSIEDLLVANLRKVLFSRPDREMEIQNAIETLLVGRGFGKGVNYDREAGKIKFSGKEFIPDFIFPDIRLALEVKLLKDRADISKCVEEMSADIPSYLSGYASLLFCVYDLGAIRDVHEFQEGIAKQPGVRIYVVKH